jgi:hypothetical protein
MKKIVFLICLAILTTAFYEGSESKYLFWKPDTKLRWSDFQGHIKPEDDAAASASYIGFFHTIKKCSHPDSIILDTRAYFNKNRSWVKVPAVNPSLLLHEQLHFDLAELYSRRFRKAIQGMTFSASSYVHCIDSVYKSYSESGDSTHVLYDIETNHGLDKASQETWNEYVKSNLTQMNQWEFPRLKLYIPK